jgi:hypothetical protein
VSVDEITDRLYALTPAEFTQARTAAVRELRRSGEREQADVVKALRRPTAAAGAVNRLVRAHRAQVEAFLDAAANLRDAQFAGKGDLGAAAHAERVALEELVELGGESVRPSLQAAAVDDEIARNLLAARLVREPEPAGFGTLLAYAEPATTNPAAKPTGNQRNPGSARRDDSVARAGLQKATKLLRAAEVEELQAQQHWAHTQRALEKAQAAVDKAQRKLDRLHGV